VCIVRSRLVKGTNREAHSLFAVLAFVVSAPCAYADSVPILDINITYATASMGSDGSVDFALFGPGTTITGYGGMGCFSWCSGPIPDLSSVSAAQVFVGAFLSAKVAGISYSPDLFGLNCCLFSSSGDLSASVSGIVGQDVTFRYLNLALLVAEPGPSTSTFSLP
jgi:hypothetical protein